ncbi:MAG: YggT family protein [Frankiaceae bacterium]|jgi:YggT family protein|nr:YggT family protein [Frankiaceae bacterium]MDQ1724399.1 YggT family protein [Frankiaceae bacterium]
MNVVAVVIVDILRLYLFILFVRVVFDWVFVLNRSWRPSGPLVIVLEIVYSVTDPPLRLLRRFIPSLRLGTFSLDLAFLVLVILIYVLISAVSSWGTRL